MQQQPRKARMASAAPAAGLPAPRRSPPCPRSDRALLQNCERVSVAEAAQCVAFCYGSHSKRMQTNSYKRANNKNENISKVGWACLRLCGKWALFFPVLQQLRIRGPWHWGAPGWGLTRGLQGHLLGSAWIQGHWLTSASLYPHFLSIHLWLQVLCTRSISRE